MMSTLLKSVMLKPRDPGRQARSLVRREARSLHPGGPRARVRKTLRRSQKREPTRTLTTPRTKRLPKRRKRRLMNHVS